MHELREGISAEQITLSTHSLPILVEDQRLRLPGEPSVRLQASLINMEELYTKEMSLVKQSSLARAMHKRNYTDLKVRLQREGEYHRAALLLSATPQRQVSRWLKGGLFLNLHYRLTPQEFLECLRSRLMVPEYPGVVGVCGCRLRVPLSQGHHLLSCQVANREITFRHDRVRGALAAWCKKCVGVQGSVLEEVTWPRRGELAACRPDILVTTALGEEYIIDVAVANCMSNTYVYGDDTHQLIPAEKGAAFEPGFAAEQRSADKRRYALTCLSPEQLARFIPFSVEMTGRLGEDAIGFMTLMQQCHNTRVGDGAPALFRKLKASLFLELGMILARGTARIMETSRGEVRRRAHPVYAVGDDEDFFDALDGDPNFQLTQEAVDGLGVALVQ